jgi:uncharacterized protein YndB with AHSA1/START domain
MAKEIVIQRVYPYTVDTVWRAIASAEALSEWLMPTDFSLAIGQEFVFHTKPQPGFDGLVRCRIVDFVVPTKLQYTWQGGPMKKPTLVSFELSPVPEGTKLLFRHSGFEGFINQYIVRFVLEAGWKKLLSKKINAYLIS